VDAPLLSSSHPPAPKDFPADAPQPLNLFDDVVSPTENIDDALFTNRKDPRCFTEIGTGVLPIQDLLDAASKLPKLDYLFLGTGPHRPAGDRVDPTQQRRIFRQVHRHFLALSQAAILRRADT
jgi:hypothetical protein